MTYGVNAPNGLVPVNTGNGAAWNSQANWYPITATYASTMFKGDPVTLSTAGTVIRATASQAVLGILDQVTYQTSANPQFFSYVYWPGNPGVVSGTQPMAYVIDDPDVSFTVQETDSGGASGTPLTQASVGNNVNFLYTAGSTLSGISAVSINNGSTSTALVANLKIVSLDNRAVLGVPGAAPSGNQVGGVQQAGAFANWICQFNNHVYKAGSTRP